MPADKNRWLKKTLGACLAFSFSTLILASAIHTPAALAHAEHGSEGGIPTISTKAKLPNGVSLQVVKSNAYQFALATDGKQKIEVLGEDKRPFLRFEGEELFADLNASGWHRSLLPGGGPLPQRLKTKVRLKPNWVLINRQTGYGWYDPRLMNEQVPHFNLGLLVNGKPLSVRVERIEPAAMTGYWRPVLTGEPPHEGLNAMVPGLSGNSLMLSRLPVADAEFQVMDDNNRPVIELRADGVWLDTQHPWASRLDLFYSRESKETAWVRISESSTITYADPRLARKPAKTSETGKWLIPVKIKDRETVGVLAGELQWQKIEAGK
ncbi:MAG TPA: hypothetical protein VFV28_00415 [Limnobacter sp.]|nr:hypothetical protein [Limnobacter sp.]